MNTIKLGFVNKKNESFPNIRDIHFDRKEDLYDNLGTFITETKYESNIFLNFSCNSTNGAYIYKSYYDSKKSLKIYKDFADYKFCCHNDEILISELQKKQKYIKLTDFPTGIVSVENYVIGQEIFYYEKYQTLYDAIRNTNNPTILYLNVLKILRELLEHGIVYEDIHAKNFLVNNDVVKLIDFESHYINFNKKQHNIIKNLKEMLNNLNAIIGIKFNDSYMKSNTLDEIEYCVIEKNYTLIKK